MILKIEKQNKKLLMIDSFKDILRISLINGLTKTTIILDKEDTEKLKEYLK